MEKAVTLPLNGDIERIMRCEETLWINPKLETMARVAAQIRLGEADIFDAAQRLSRFAPLIQALFPETAGQGGIIESPLAPAFRLQKALNPQLQGALYIKRDDSLPIAGSIKARGGIYEVLKYAQRLAEQAGLYKTGESCLNLLNAQSRAFFAQRRIQVGSTGNLGLSIGISGAALGFQVVVHMSADAQGWKKELLKSQGVTVVEYSSDYSQAVENGRRQSGQDPYSYFVDDENSEALFLGYAVAAGRLKTQLTDTGAIVDAEHPLFVYIPCGVGGAPAGIALGLKYAFGDNVHVFLAEPVQAPCMLLGLATGLFSGVSIQDAGLSGKTIADGLAVGRPSDLAASVLDRLVSGILTVADERLPRWLRMCHREEGIFLEPSACAEFAGPERLFSDEAGLKYIKGHGIAPYLNNSTHIVWATGGGLVPQNVRERYLQR